MAHRKNGSQEEGVRMRKGRRLKGKKGRKTQGENYNIPVVIAPKYDGKDEMNKIPLYGIMYNSLSLLITDEMNKILLYGIMYNSLSLLITNTHSVRRNIKSDKVREKQEREEKNRFLF